MKGFTKIQDLENSLVIILIPTSGNKDKLVAYIKGFTSGIDTVNALAKDISSAVENGLCSIDVVSDATKVYVVIKPGKEFAVTMEALS